MQTTGPGIGGERSAHREAFLFLHALRLAVKAQGVRRRPLAEVASEMAAAGRLPRGVGAAEATRAAGRAGVRVRRWAHGLDSCLTRSLVVGALLADRPGVFLHVGFRPHAAGSAVEGHAWVSVGGEAVAVTAPAGHAGPFEESLRLPMRRAPGGERP